jgi:hypothetical protein
MARAPAQPVERLQAPEGKDKIKAQAQLLDQQALALTMAVDAGAGQSRSLRVQATQAGHRDQYFRSRRIERQVGPGFKADNLSRQT